MEYKPAAAPSGQYQIVWMFADNSNGSSDAFFAVKTPTGTQKFGTVPAGKIARQQVFTNEQWGVVDSSGKPVAGGQFQDINQANMWVRLG